MPSSRTSSVRSSSVWVSRTTTCLAWECLATLVSDSWKTRNAELASVSGIVQPSAQRCIVTSIPVRVPKSWPSHSIVAARPSWSSTLGRSSVAIRRTVLRVSSIRWTTDAHWARTSWSRGRRSFIHATSILRPVSAWPSSS